MTDESTSESFQPLLDSEVKSADWTKFTRAMQALPLWRRFFLYPYAYYLACMCQHYVEWINNWHITNRIYYLHRLMYATLLPAKFQHNKKLRLSLDYDRNQLQTKLHEFDACCDINSCRSLESMLLDQCRVLGQYYRSITKRPLPANFFAAIFGAIYMPFLMIVYFIAELCLSGKARQSWLNFYSRNAAHFDDPREIQDMSLQARPIVLLGLYAAPFTAVILMGRQLISDTLALFRKPTGGIFNDISSDCLRLRQNIDRRKEIGPAAFYFSPVFGWTLFFVFISGIPAFISFWLYNHFGIDPLLGYPSHDEGFFKVFVIIGLYITSFSCCLMSLFFTGYFSYLTNFGSTEYDIEIYPDLIKQLPIKGWAADILFFPLHHPLKRLFWQDIQTVKLKDSELELKLAAQNSDNKWLKRVYKLNSVFQNCLHKLDVHSEYLEIATASDSILIRLWELSQKERAQVFYSLRKYAPSIYLSPAVQESLTGSTVLKDPRYTEIWFDLLTRTNYIDDRTELCAGSKLKEGKFTIDKKLGSGGQANIYLAKDVAGQIVVLKEFQLTPGESLGSLVESAAAFESESTILSQLDHPGIVKLYDLFMEGNKVYLSLEHVNGQTLRELVRDKGPLAQTQVIDIAQQMCVILNYLHGHSPAIVHRDFTPDNIILQNNGQLKLIDFSVAQGQKKNGSNCAGKHCYTPPEQFRGEASAQSDIYALGGTLYFLMTGEDPQPISKSSIKIKRPDVSDQLNLIVEKCTELLLEERYESTVWLKLEVESLANK